MIIIMASEQNFASDSEDTYITDVPDHHKMFMKSKIIDYLSEVEDFTVQILRTQNQPPQLIFNLGSEHGKPVPSCHRQRSTKILVKNIPTGFDEQYLQMFFEYEKGQGGGPVKTVKLYREDDSAIIEFQNQKSVDVVLKKRPIKIMETKVEVELFAPYLEKDEALISTQFVGLPNDLSEDFKKLHMGNHPNDGCTKKERELQQQIRVTIKLSKENEKIKEMLQDTQRLVRKLSVEPEELRRKLEEARRRQAEIRDRYEQLKAQQHKTADKHTDVHETQQKGVAVEEVKLIKDFSMKDLRLKIPKGSIGKLISIKPSHCQVFFQEYGVATEVDKSFLGFA